MNIKYFLSHLIKFLNLVFILITIALLFIVFFKKEWIELFFEWLKIFVNSLGNWNYLIIFLISIIESFPVIGVIVPGQQAMLIVGGVFAKFNLLPVIICASIGALIGNYIGFLLGILYGNKFFKKYGNWFGVGVTEIKYIKNSVIKHGALFTIFGKFHNTTRAFIPFIVGSMDMCKTRFWIYNFIGSVLWATVIIILGTLFVEYYKQILEYINYIFSGIFILIGFYIYFFKKESFKKYLKEKEKEIEEIL